MTPKPRHFDNNNDVVDTRLRDRCQAYLLGELEPTEAAEFERTLDQPVVAEAVASESDLLLQLAAATELPPQRELPAIRLPERSSLRKVTVAICGVAAVFLLALLAQQQARDTSNVAESATVDPLQLAKALAEPAVDWESPNESPNWETGEMETAVIDNFPDEPTEDDDIAWLLVALESTELGNENDG